MSNEDIKKIQDAINQAQAPSLISARNKHLEEQRKVQEIADQIKLNESRLRSTTVVDLFIQLRDSKTLIIENGASRVNDSAHVGYGSDSNEIPLPSSFKNGTRLPYTPAIVRFSNDHSEVSIYFDRYQTGYSAIGQMDGPTFSNHSLNAKISAQGQLTVNGKVVDNNLVQVVQQSILEQKGLV